MDLLNLSFNIQYLFSPHANQPLLFPPSTMSSPSPSTRYILEQVFSNLGLLFWSFQLLPQNHRTRSTGTLSPLMMLLWTLWTPIFAAGAIRSGLAVALIWWWRGLGDGRVKEGRVRRMGCEGDGGECCEGDGGEGEERIERDGIVKDPGKGL
ncbi:hypothetical protein BC829DRAFT_437458 [Chytridium lagenaria]|nr:hypothetical protein BC829DRAFT_437458 [Chytridium lagenaria]